MKSIQRKLAGSAAALAAVFAVGSLLDAAVAANAPPPPPAAQGEHGPPHHRPMGGHGHGMGMMEAPGMVVFHAFHELDLTADQKDKLHALMEDEHAQMMKSQGDPPDLVALGDPANPGHAAAIEAAKQRALAHVQHAAEVEKKAWDLLTAEQKAKLPKVLADLQKRLREHEGHEGHEGHGPMGGPGDEDAPHGAGPGGPPPR